MSTRAIAAVVFIAITLPALDAVLKRFVTAAVFAYFALAQFPIYLSPLLLGPLARRLKAGAGLRSTVDYGE